MDTHFASQLPDPLNRIELRTIGRQEVKTQKSPLGPQPGFQGSRMMVSGVIQNNDHFLLRETVTKKMDQKYLKCLPVKIFPLLSDQFSVPQTDRPKHPYRLMRWGVPENGVFHLGGNPHHIAGAMLLEMALIQTPKIKVASSQKLTQFFYMPPALRDLLRQSPPGASVGEIQTGGKSADIGVPRSLIQRPVLYDAIAKSHPTVPGNNPRRWAVSVNPPLIVSSGANPKKKAALSPRHRGVHSSRPLGSDGTNTGWFGASGPINRPLHTCSSPGKGKAIHAGGDHTGLLGISIFPAGGSTLQPLGRRILAFPWLPPFG